MSPQTLHVVAQRYGGSAVTDDTLVTLPFVLTGEKIEVDGDGALLRVIEPSVHRVDPACPHFGVCGGCQYQMIEARAQGELKRDILIDELRRVGVQPPAELALHTADPYGYRNRIRLRVESVDGVFRVGYNVRHSTQFLPIVTCPIAAPPLFQAAEALLALAGAHPDAALLLTATHEVELFINDDLSRLQLTFFAAPRTKLPQGTVQRTFAQLQERLPHLSGIGVDAYDPRTGPTGRTLDAAGSPGLNYRVNEETHWIARGNFFQVNRFLLPALAQLATTIEGATRAGRITWDLYAGVGLFSRILAQNFTSVTAVESNRNAARDLSTALAKLAPRHRVVNDSTLAFLQRAVLDRERPDLIVADPPRAGLGAEVCALLLRIAAPQIVYISCDPTTLSRDLSALTARGYAIERMDVVDLFPQTFHLETVAVLRHHK